MSHSITQQALEILDDDKLDREWIVRNVLGGLSAGFGLRGWFYSIALCVCACISDTCLSVVVLDIPPPLTTVIILVG